MRDDLSRMAWRTEELADALAAAAGVTPGAALPWTPTDDPEERLRLLAASVGLEADPCPTARVPEGPRDAVLVELDGGGGEPGWLVLTGRGRRQVRVLGPDGSRRRVRRRAAAELLGGGGGDDGARWAETLAAAGLEPRGPGAGRAGVRTAPVRPVRAWRLLPAADLPLAVAAVRWGVTGALGSLVAAHGCQYLLWVGSWWLLGWGALGGRLEPGWVAAWALLLLTRLPFSAAATAAAGHAVLRFGLLLRRRLLAGASRMQLGSVRATGVGQLTGRLLEAATFETQVFHGGLLTLTATLELAVALAILGLGAGGALHVGLLGVWLALVAVFAGLDARAREAWSSRRLDVADLTVERIAGHLTRVVQQDPERWHEGEDEAASALAVAARRLDRSGAVPLAVLRRSWPLAGIAWLGPAVVSQPDSLGGVAVGLGGVLLAAASLSNLTNGLQRLVAARIAWRQMGDLVTLPSGGSGPASSVPLPGPGALSVSGLRVARRGRAVLDGLDLELGAGDHLLVEGGCGCGKTTLAEALLDLERPDGGLILLDGLDPAVLGDRWRRRVGGVPESARDHLLGGTLAFNLLLGRGWPATPEELERAVAVCRTVGLGELLERMPAGLHTQVGDTGWQLSHGERSRVLLARALLREVGTFVLDAPGEGLDPISAGRVAEVLAADPRAVLLLDRPR